MNFKKFAEDASTVFNRAVQFTGEKLGTSEKTELDAHFETLLKKADATKALTEKIVGSTERVLQPNPSVRMEDFVYEKLDKKKRDRVTNLDRLGEAMMNAGHDVGAGASYGSALVACGQTQSKLGQAERDFVHATASSYLTPLNNFLEGDMKTLQKERKVLEMKRLDLDAAKGRLRKARSANSQQQAEAELRTAQAEFDRQCEVTRLLLDGINTTHAHHLRCLSDFVEAQSTFYSQCHQHMVELQKQIQGFKPSGSEASTPGQGAAAAPQRPPPPAVKAGKRARVLYDYEAAGSTELSLVENETILVSPLEPEDPDWVMGERGEQRGRVPTTYIQLES